MRVRIKPIIHFFFLDLFFIKIINLFFSNLTISSNGSLFHETHRIVLALPFSFAPRCCDYPFSPFNLSDADLSLVGFVLRRISDN